MSALSDDSQVAASFNAAEHLARLCADTKVILNETKAIDYPRGWSDLVAQFIYELKDVPVRIVRIERSHGQLIVVFITKLQKHEMLVWRALDSAITASLGICIECGRYVPAASKSKDILSLCPNCILIGSKAILTGTWLDKYIRNDEEQS